MNDRMRVQVEGRLVELSNLDKVLFPASGFTKGEVVDYYTRVAPTLLPHLVDRPLTRIRYPNGVDSASFYEKNAPAGTPQWVRLERLPAPGSSKGRETIDYVLVQELPTLVWLANLAAIELHVPQWTVPTGRADLLVVDLDPGPPAGLPECCAVALRLRGRLTEDGLRPLPKTSGKKGMQLMCPIDGTSAQVSRYARMVAEELAGQTPGLVVSRMARHLRPGKVFIDWSQNNAAKTTVAPYSLRAQPRPTVSAPLTWAEVEDAAFTAEDFTPDVVLGRIAEYGDLLAGLRAQGAPVPAVRA